MLEPDATVRVPPHEGAPTSFGSDALQILTTEHWSLLAARNLVSVSYTHLTLPTIYSV